jgi:hypothetical protein
MRPTRAAWVFAGIDDEIIGDFGLSGGGAAGFELDTPPNAVILARSEAHQSHFVVVPEELITHVMMVTGERPKALIGAEIVYFNTTAGGAVFSTSSITSAAAFRTTTRLPHARKRAAAVHGREAAVSRIPNESRGTGLKKTRQNRSTSFIAQ